MSRSKNQEDKGNKQINTKSKGEKKDHKFRSTNFSLKITPNGYKRSSVSLLRVRSSRALSSLNYVARKSSCLRMRMKNNENSTKKLVVHNPSKDQVGFIEPAVLHQKDKFGKQRNILSHSILSHTKITTMVKKHNKLVQISSKEKPLQKIDPLYRLESDHFKVRKKVKFSFNLHFTYSFLR